MHTIQIVDDVVEGRAEVVLDGDSLGVGQVVGVARLVFVISSLRVA